MRPWLPALGGMLALRGPTAVPTARAKELTFLSTRLRPRAGEPT